MTRSIARLFRPSPGALAVALLGATFASSSYATHFKYMTVDWPRSTASTSTTFDPAPNAAHATTIAGTVFLEDDRDFADFGLDPDEVDTDEYCDRHGCTVPATLTVDPDTATTGDPAQLDELSVDTSDVIPLGTSLVSVQVDGTGTWDGHDLDAFGLPTEQGVIAMDTTLVLDAVRLR